MGFGEKEILKLDCNGCVTEYTENHWILHSGECIWILHMKTILAKVINYSGVYQLYYVPLNFEFPLGKNYVFILDIFCCAHMKRK